MAAIGVRNEPVESPPVSSTAAIAGERVRRWIASHQALPVALLILGIFLYCSWFGLGTRLDDDDIMNLNFAWVPPWRELLVALLAPFTHFYRPAGALLYRVVFEVFGLNFTPFRVVIYLLLAANIYLVSRLARRISGSPEVAAIAALLFTFHGRMTGIYKNNGTLYDVLCATFSLLTLLYYISLRQKGRRIRPVQWIGCFGLFTFAMNAKEMAAVLPALVLFYEWLWFRPAPVTLRGTGRWLRTNAVPALAGGVLAALSAWSRMGTGGVLYGHPAYAMKFTPAQVMSHWTRLMNSMFYLPDDTLTDLQAGLIAIGLVAVAAVARRKDLWWFAAFALLGPLPIIFIPWRGFFVMYLPYAGWAMFAATVLVEGRDWLWRHIWKRPPLPDNAFEPERIFVFAAVAIVLIWAPRTHAPELQLDDPSYHYIRNTKNDLIRLRQPLPTGARVLLLHDHFPAMSWGPLELIRLVYKDRTLWVDRPTMMKTPPNPAAYDCIFDYAGNYLMVVRARPLAGRSVKLPR